MGPAFVNMHESNTSTGGLPPSLGPTFRVVSEDEVFDKPSVPASPTTSTRGGIATNGRKIYGAAVSTDYRPLPMARQPVHQRAPYTPPPDQDNHVFRHTVRDISPMRPSAPSHIHYALESLKDDLERTQQNLRLPKSEYGLDQKTEIFIDSILQEELVKPVQRARQQQLQQQQRQQKQQQEHSFQRYYYPRGSDSSVESGLLKSSYPLTRKDAKKRKEARFRSHRRRRTSKDTGAPRRSVSPPLSERREKDDNPSDSNGKEAFQRLKQDFRLLQRFYHEKRSTNRNNETKEDDSTAERLVDSLVDAFSCKAVDDVLMAAYECGVPPSAKCNVLNNERDDDDDDDGILDTGNEDDPTISTCDDTATFMTMDDHQATAFLSDEPGVLRSRATNNSNTSKDTPTVAQLLKLRKELHQLQHVSSTKEDHPHDEIDEPFVRDDSFKITVTTNNSPNSKQRPKKSVRFAAPLVTKIKHRPYTHPDEIERLFFVPEELDEYELDRETTDGDQFECRLVEKSGRTQQESIKSNAAAHRAAAGHGYMVAVSFNSRPKVPFDPCDELMLSPSDLSALKD